MQSPQGSDRGPGRFRGLSFDRAGDGHIRKMSISGKVEHLRPSERDQSHALPAWRLAWPLRNDHAVLSPTATDRTGEITMFKASAGTVLPTSIIGSLPRPSWYNAVLGTKSFLEAMVHARFREQYEDAVSVHLRAQETAGLDICTDGDAHYDEEVGGLSWQSYPLTHMAGFDATPQPTAY